MASTMSTFSPSNNTPDEPWLFAGLASSFPNIVDSSEPYFKLAWAQPVPCLEDSSSSSPQKKAPGCKVFHPKHSTMDEIDIDAAVGEDAWLMREQVLVFQYKGRFHAVDHACPHRAYSLSWGQPFDIEDAGRLLGQGIRCRGHSYTFELTTGIGDRGNYRLGIWDVELRSCRGQTGLSRDREVWVRKRAKDAT